MFTISLDFLWLLSRGEKVGFWKKVVWQIFISICLLSLSTFIIIDLYMLNNLSVCHETVMILDYSQMVFIVCSWIQFTSVLLNFLYLYSPGTFVYNFLFVFVCVMLVLPILYRIVWETLVAVLLLKSGKLWVNYNVGLFFLLVRKF